MELVSRDKYFLLGTLNKWSLPLVNDVEFRAVTVSYRSPLYLQIRIEYGLRWMVASIEEEFFVLGVVKSKAVARTDGHLIDLAFGRDHSMTRQKFAVDGHHFAVES